MLEKDIKDILDSSPEDVGENLKYLKGAIQDVNIGRG